MLFMLLFNIRRLRGDKSCMVEDKNGVGTANKVYIKPYTPNTFQTNLPTTTFPFSKILHRMPSHSSWSNQQ
jgi:hypothetical protein